MLSARIAMTEWRVARAEWRTLWILNKLLLYKAAICICAKQAAADLGACLNLY